MYAVTGITGQVGGAVARALLGAGQSVRAVVRSAEKGESWAQLGCEVALAEVDDAQAMASAFSGTEGVFIMMPSNFDPLPGFPEARLIIDNIRQALERGRPAKVVCLSTIGAHVTQPNLLNQLQLLERGLSSLGMPVTMSVVPREDWSGLFTAQGARNPQPRMQMIDGFNEGWIEFSGTPRKGLVVLETVLCELVRRAGACDR